MERQVIIKELKNILGENAVFTDQDHLLRYGIDRTTQYIANPLAIVFPKDTRQVQQVVLLANQHNFALVPSGGRTGLSGGACATNHEIVVSMERMNKILAFNEMDRLVTCEAGVITANVQAFAELISLFFPIDLVSSGSSQIGGNVATNAGGNRVIRYGMMRHYVKGLTLVTGKGEIIQLGRGLKKNNAGYDLMQLCIGSEGTLGIICEVELELVKMPVIQTALLRMSGLSHIPALFCACEKYLNLLSFEYFSDVALSHVLSARNITPPFHPSPSSAYILLEHDGSVSDMEKTLQPLLDEGLVEDCIISSSIKQTLQLRAYREGISEAIGPRHPLKCDVAIKASAVAVFVAQVMGLVAQYPEWQLVLFGHIGDGNLHVNFLPPELEKKMDRESLEKNVYDLVVRLGGSLSAEHGIGLIKRHLLVYYPAMFNQDITGELKKIFDPAGVLNPGKLINY